MNTNNQQRESAQEHRERRISHYIVYFTQFNIIIAYSTVLTGIWPYLNKLDPTAGKSFLGYLIGFSALGQMICSPLIGRWSNKINSSRIPFILSLVICIISYLIHASLECFENHRKYWMLFSRFLAGVGSANISLCRSHISTTTLIAERRKSVVTLSICATVGLAVGPIIQSIVIPLGDEGIWLIPKIIKLDMYTGIAWFLIGLTIINIFLFVPGLFKEHNMLRREVAQDGHETYFNKNYKYLAWTFILLNFSVTFNFMFTKILGTPLAMDEFAMSRTQAITLNSFVMLAGAGIAFVTIALIHPLCKIIPEMKLLIVGVILMITGRFFFYPIGTERALVYDDISYQNVSNSSVGCPLSQNWCLTQRKLLFWQFIAGNVFENIGYSFVMTLVMTIFSKSLGSKQQGTWMGILTGIGSIARVISPVFISTLYEKYGPSFVTITTNLLFMLSTGCLLKLACTFIGTSETVVNAGGDISIHSSTDAHTNKHDGDIIQNERIEHYDDALTDESHKTLVHEKN